MNKPFWFNAILQWKEMGKGFYGISFPFLVGAISLESKAEIDESFINNVFSEIQNNPVEGYYCEVRWCGDIDEPVASIKPLSDLEEVSIQASLEGNEQVSFGFTTDLMGMFTLNCTTAIECRKKLVQRTLDTVKDGNFSKNSGEFTPFTDGDIDFIKAILKLTRT